VRVWLDEGIRLVQLRAKGWAAGPLLAEADALVALAGRYGAAVIINDRADIARQARAGGVHVGQADLSPADVRAAWPEAPVVGLSTHTDDEVLAGLTSGADYLAIGPVFATGSKRGAGPVVGLAGVGRARTLSGGGAGPPLVAIGGIDRSTARSVFEAGADSVAVISDLVASDPVRRVREWLAVAGTP
jgi:thiamine-phosphate pyrophosphorylase